jgi:hypothetical protein
MSNEITVRVSLRATKSGATVQFSDSGRADMSGEHRNDVVQDLTSTEAAVALGNVAVAGWVAFEPLTSNTDFCVVGVKPSGTFIAMANVYPNSPGQVIRVGANALWAKSNSGTQRVRFVVVES